jgi:N-acetylglutamate synthase-like GNAT family acetyltransferase
MLDSPNPLKPLSKSVVSFTLRPATSREARAIRALIYRVGINPMGLDWWRFLIAVDEQGHLIGTGQIKPHGDGTRELASIAVQPEYQKQGIGRVIIERLLVDNPLPLYLTCASHNMPYYLKFGFRVLEDAELPPYFRRLRWIVRLLKTVFRIREEMLVMVKDK